MCLNSYEESWVSWCGIVGERFCFCKISALIGAWGSWDFGGKGERVNLAFKPKFLLFISHA